MTDGSNGGNSPSLFDLLEGAAKAAGVLGACGYISLRAHVNRLGLPLTDVTPDRYLMETWHFVETMAERYLLLVGFGAILYFVARLVIARARPRHAREGPIPQTPESALGEAVLMILAAACAYLTYLRQIHALGHDVAIGTLRAENLAHIRPSPAALDVLFLGCLIAFPWMSRWDRERRSGAQSSLNVEVGRRTARWAWIAIALHVPFAFGLTEHNTSYAQACVVPKGSGGAPAPAPTPDAGIASAGESPHDPVCGLLLAQSKDDVTLWQTKRSCAKALVIPKSDTRLEVSGLQDLLAVASGDSHDAGCD